MKKSSLFRIFVILIISSALTALIVFFVMPEFGKKYKADLIELYSESNSISTFYDLDYDGVSENISFKHDTNKPFVIVKDGISLTIIEQWNFHTGTFGDFGFANFDHDTLQEVYFTYFINDSINLYQIVPIRNSHKKSIFISFTSQHQGEYEYPGTFAGTYDLNDDGFNEIIFTFEAGFTLKPRKIIAWDVKNDTIYSSPFSGTAIFYPDIEDINNDNNLEILGQTRAFDNCENFPYSDSTAWLMVLDDQLNFLFEPVPIGENYSIVTYKPINSQENRNIIALHTSNTKEMSSEILLFSAMGKLISKKPLPADYSYADSWL
ncbi:MAG: hypothetical protein RBS55_12700, partial [Bacteroidales bacterium]|nr:hypothetical protein [Bacteroidales bacterium]